MNIFYAANTTGNKVPRPAPSEPEIQLRQFDFRPQLEFVQDELQQRVVGPAPLALDRPRNPLEILTWHDVADDTGPEPFQLVKHFMAPLAGPPPR